MQLCRMDSSAYTAAAGFCKYGYESLASVHHYLYSDMVHNATCLQFGVSCGSKARCPQVQSGSCV
jgi:hypothetical protein